MRERTDLVAVLTGALMIRSGEAASLYDLAAQHTYQARVLAPYLTLKPDTTLPNSHPPYESLLLAPLIGLPYPVIFCLWTALELVALGAALLLLSVALPPVRHVRWIIVALACAYYPVHNMLWLGQSSTLLLLGLCGAYVAIKSRRDSLAGVALAFLALKPQMVLPVALLLLVQGRWKPLTVMASIQVGLSVAVMPLLGVAWPLRYARFLLDVRDWGENLGEHPSRMYNWRGLALHLAEPWSPTLVTPLFGGLVAVSVGLVLWAAWVGRREAVDVEGAQGLAPTTDLPWTLVGLVTVLLPVHLYQHDWTLLILPGWILAVYATRGVWGKARSLLWLMLLWGGFFLAPLGFVALASPSLAVVPNVLLVALAIIFLAWQLSLPCQRQPDRVTASSADLGAILPGSASLR